MIKRAEYADAQIPEYWIVNPMNETITILALEGMTYADYGLFHRGEQASSARLEGLGISVDGLFDAQ